MGWLDKHAFQQGRYENPAFVSDSEEMKQKVLSVKDKYPKS